MCSFLDYLNLETLKSFSQKEWYRVSAKVSTLIETLSKVPTKSMSNVPCFLVMDVQTLRPLQAGMVIITRNI